MVDADDSKWRISLAFPHLESLAGHFVEDSACMRFAPLRTSTLVTDRQRPRQLGFVPDEHSGQPPSLIVAVVPPVQATLAPRADRSGREHHRARFTQNGGVCAAYVTGSAALLSASMRGASHLNAVEPALEPKRHVRRRGQRTLSEARLTAHDIHPRLSRANLAHAEAYEALPKLRAKNDKLEDQLRSPG